MPAAAMTMEKPAISFADKKRSAKKAVVEESQDGVSDATDWLGTPEGITYLKSIFDKDDHDMSRQKLYTLEEFRHHTEEMANRRRLELLAEKAK